MVFGPFSLWALSVPHFQLSRRNGPGKLESPCVRVAPTLGWLATHNNYYPSEDVLVVVDPAQGLLGAVLAIVL